MATEGTKFQLNYKLNDGTLINLYAATVAELESGLADLAMNANNIRTTGIELNGGIAVTPTVASVAAAFNATPVAQDPGSAPSCRHGAMNYREGVSQRGPWKAHMCSAPKGATDKCDPIFMR
jgi:hypothetical protein